MTKTRSIDPAPFIAALRSVVRALPLPDDDRAHIIAAIEERASASYRHKQSVYNRARIKAGFVRKRTKAQRVAATLCMRRFRERAKIAKKIVRDRMLASAAASW